MTREMQEEEPKVKMPLADAFCSYHNLLRISI